LADVYSINAYECHGITAKGLAALKGVRFLYVPTVEDPLAACKALAGIHAIGSLEEIFLGASNAKCEEAVVHLTGIYSLYISSIDCTSILENLPGVHDILVEDCQITDESLFNLAKVSAYFQKCLTTFIEWSAYNSVEFCRRYN
jgi:hypothetical protein